eukprot:15247348-Ditylum_brightwellii.AAC.1
MSNSLCEDSILSKEQTKLDCISITLMFFNQRFISEEPLSYGFPSSSNGLQIGWSCVASKCVATWDK